MKVDKFNISKLEYYLIILTQIYLVKRRFHVSGRIVLTIGDFLSWYSTGSKF